MKLNFHLRYLTGVSAFFAFLATYSPVFDLSAQILEQTKTLTIDVNDLISKASSSQPLKVLLKRNREKALWLMNTTDGQSYGVSFRDPATAPQSTTRFNPRRCMRVITDSLVAAKFGYVRIDGQTIDPDLITDLRTRAVDELRHATDQALAAPNRLWPWWAPMDPEIPHKGTLEAAEATACLAVGYDWLRGSPIVPPEDRVRTRQALLKALHRLEDYAALKFAPNQCRESCKLRKECSTSCWSNWNAVISGAEIVAGIAIKDDVTGEDRAFVDAILQRAPETLKTYLKLFSYSAEEPSRNGAYPEGATYLNFSLEYLALADAALGKSRGTLSGIDYSGTGVREAPTFALDMLSASSSILKGPSGVAAGLSINYSDGSSTVVPSIAAQSWFGLAHGKLENAAAAQHLGQAAMTDTVREHAGAYTMDALAILWFKDVTTPWVAPGDGVRLYGDTSGHNNIAFLRRSPRNKPVLNAMLKGGMAAETPHGHMDIGSFILEALGRRWSFDLSHESYTARNYFSLNSRVFPSRWDYLRANNRGHNTLIIDGQLQDPTAVAPISIATVNTESETAAVVNLTPIYKSQAASTRRRLALTDRGDFIIKDVISGARPGSTVTWQMIYCGQTNPGKGVCYPAEVEPRTTPPRNPIVVSTTAPNEAVIAEEVYSTDCPKPRRLEVSAISPRNALLVSSQLIAPDLNLPATRTERAGIYEQEDSAMKGDCFVLSTSVPALAGDTTIEIKLTPRRRN